MFLLKKIFENVLTKYSESKHLEARQGWKIVFIEGEKYQLRPGQPAVVERGRNTKPTKEKYIS